MTIKSPKNFWSGIMFLVSGLFFAIWAESHYQMGSAVRMGPAYFPVVLGYLLAVLGAIILLTSFTVKGPRVPVFYLRPVLFISIATVLYGYLMKPLGLILATAALVYVSLRRARVQVEGGDHPVRHPRPVLLDRVREGTDATLPDLAGAVRVIGGDDGHLP
jgi:hypothetical protein